MNTEQLINSGIANISTVYKGIRGSTLSSYKNLRFWRLAVLCGIRSIIELRREDHSDRLTNLCILHDIRYISFPIDSDSVPNSEIAQKLPEFFQTIDNGDFYISCAMGLHRTDIALSIYWVFHGADLGLPPPELKGHTIDGNLLITNINNRILRRLNSLYRYLKEHDTIPIPEDNVFKIRKSALLTNRLR